MALQVVVQSTSGGSLTTVESLREMALGATATSTAMDAYLAKLVARGSQWAETYMNRGPVSVATYRETVAGFGRRSLMLSRTPVRAIKAVYNATDTGTAVLMNTSEFIVEDAEAGLVARNVGFAWDAALQWRGAAVMYGDAIPLDPAPLSGQEYKPWLVDYVAGWTLDGISTDSENWSTEKGTTSTGRTLPYDVEQAVLQRAQVMFQNRDGVESETLGDLSVKYNGRSQQDDDLWPYEETLAAYRRFL